MSTNDPVDPLPPAPEPQAPESENGHQYPIVGVGASAGGLEALTELLQGFSDEPGMAFLVAMHLDPHQKSHLPQILSKTTSMTVREASEEMIIEVDHVYLLPPNTNM